MISLILSFHLPYGHFLMHTWVGQVKLWIADDGPENKKVMDKVTEHQANAENHHPDFSAGYNFCEVTFTTHAIDGLSDNDFICAAKLNALL